MKRVLLTASLFALAATALADDTAYTALRVVGRSQGKEAINHVVELRGRSGSPQPAVWKVTLDEPRARGGVREIDVQRGKIISERTPAAARTPGRTMNFNQLNLDSDGAFTVANQEAQKGGIPFDHVDYILSSGTGGDAPVWRLELLDTKLGRAGSIDVAADTGTVLSQNLRMPTASRANDGRTYLDGGRRNPPPPVNDRYPDESPRSSGGDSGNSRPGEPFRNVSDFFHRLGKRFEKRGGQLENFFTGKGARAARERSADDYGDGR